MASTSVPAGLRRAFQGPRRALRGVGQQLAFYAQAYGYAYKAVTSYRAEVMRQLSAVTLGTGGLALVGGTIVVTSVITASAGVVVGLQGFEALRALGADALTGFLAGYVDVRLAAPLIAGVGLVSTVGASFTAELGAQRISDEIDALEVMSVPSIPYLVTTRIVAGAVAIVPLYAVALFACFAVSRTIVVLGFSQSPGTYDHYFETFLFPSDVLNSVVEMLFIVVVVMSIHTYYGYNATGGPAGVGEAVGRAVRLSLIAVFITALAVSLVFYGDPETIHLSR